MDQGFIERIDHGIDIPEYRGMGHSSLISEGGENHNWL